MKSIVFAGIMYLNGCSQTLDVIPNTQQTTQQTNQGQTGTPQKPTPIVRNDLIANVTLGNYKVGDSFNYSSAIKNNTIYDIKLDNVKKTSLEYILLKEDKVLESKKLEEDLTITLNKEGYISVSHIDNNFKFTIGNAEIVYGGKKYISAFGLTFSKTLQLPTLTFKETGRYEVQLKVNYSLIGQNYESVFSTGGFEVGK